MEGGVGHPFLPRKIRGSLQRAQGGTALPGPCWTSSPSSWVGPSCPHFPPPAWGPLCCHCSVRSLSQHSEWLLEDHRGALVPAPSRPPAGSTRQTQGQGEDGAKRITELLAVGLVSPKPSRACDKLAHGRGSSGELVRGFQERRGPQCSARRGTGNHGTSKNAVTCLSKGGRGGGWSQGRLPVGGDILK